MTDPVVQGPFQEAVALAFPPALGELWFCGDVFLAYFNPESLSWVFSGIESGILFDLDQITDGPIVLGTGAHCAFWNGLNREEVGIADPAGRDVLAARYFASLSWFGGLFDDLSHRDSTDLEGVAWLATYDHTTSTWAEPANLSDLGGDRQGVHALEILNNVLYVAGRFSFTDPGSSLTGYSLGYWQPGTGLRRVAGGGINPPNASFVIRALTRYDGKLYLGGYHTRPTVPSDHIVALDESTGVFSALPNGGLNDEVRDLAVSAAGELWVVGDFTKSADGTKDLRYAAIFDGTSWREPDAANYITATGLNAGVRTVIADGATMWIGGKFDDIGGDTDLRDVARFVGNQWLTGYRSNGSDVILVNQFRLGLVAPTMGKTRLTVTGHGITTETITVSGTGFYDGDYDSSSYSVIDSNTIEIDATFFGTASGTLTAPGAGIELDVYPPTGVSLPATVVMYGSVYYFVSASILAIPDTTTLIVDTPFLGNDSGGYTAYFGTYYELGNYKGVTEVSPTTKTISAAVGTGI